MDSKYQKNQRLAANDPPTVNEQPKAPAGESPNPPAKVVAKAPPRESSATAVDGRARGERQDAADEKGKGFFSQAKEVVRELMDKKSDKRWKR